MPFDWGQLGNAASQVGGQLAEVDPRNKGFAQNLGMANTGLQKFRDWRTESKKKKEGAGATPYPGNQPIDMSITKQPMEPIQEASPQPAVGGFGPPQIKAPQLDRGPDWGRGGLVRPQPFGQVLTGLGSILGRRPSVGGFRPPSPPSAGGPRPPAPGAPPRRPDLGSGLLGGRGF